MLKQVAEGVLVHQSELLQNNAVVVHGRAGVLLKDAQDRFVAMSPISVAALRAARRKDPAEVFVGDELDDLLWNPRQFHAGHGVSCDRHVGVGNAHFQNVRRVDTQRRGSTLRGRCPGARS